MLTPPGLNRPGFPGDSDSEIELGQGLEMHTVRVGSQGQFAANLVCNDLLELHTLQATAPA